MCKSIMVAALLCLSMIHISPGQPASVREIAPGVFLRQGDRDQREPANSLWIRFKDYVLVIDANFPWASEEILREIRKTTNAPIRYVVDTHWHNDHTFGNCVFADAGATIVMSTECADELATRGVTSWNGWNETAHSLQGYRLEKAGLTFSDRIAFDDGSERVVITRVDPSHSKGDAVAYLPKSKILISGDLCVNWAFGNNLGDTGGNPENWIKVLNELLTWDIGTVVPGHGAPVQKQQLREQRDYLQDMLSQVREGIRLGKSVDDLARDIDLSRHGTFGVNKSATATSVRAVYRFLTSPQKTQSKSLRATK
jgi:cyclase